ncbi:glycoside hydrolase family 19 protein [Pseudoduganella flava]|nr:glycoside hydrolase family 19 protein [Pseudoduganella flava]
MTPAQLMAVMPAAGAQARLFAPLLASAMARYGIDTVLRRAAFLATVAHESSQLSRFDENLNYGAAALTRTWPRRFPPAVARTYARQPERIANRAYALREGNGDEASGDGWRYRGAGAIQLTFANNHAACARHVGIGLDAVGAWLRTPEGACRSAGWYWAMRGLNALADAGDFDGVCDVVNLGRKTPAVGDAAGWPERRGLYLRALAVLGEARVVSAPAPAPASSTAFPAAD